MTCPDEGNEPYVTNVIHQLLSWTLKTMRDILANILLFCSMKPPSRGLSFSISFVILIIYSLDLSKKVGST